MLLVLRRSARAYKFAVASLGSTTLSGAFVPQANFPAILALPEADEYGYRPAVAQDVLSEFLDTVGLPRVLTGEAGWPKSVRWLRTQADSVAPGAPALLSLTAAELDDFVPEALGAHPVWYFALPAEFETMVPGLLTASLSCYGGLTGDPWRNDVFIHLTDHPDAALLEEGDAGFVREMSFTAYGTNIRTAATKGCVIALFDCAGLLHVRGIPVGVELLEGLSGCEASTFRQAYRFYSFRNLQERTRAVEETGKDPEGAPSNGNHLLPVLSSGSVPDESGALPPHLLHRLPPVSWHSVSSAVIGRISTMTHLPQTWPAEKDAIMKVTLVSQVFEEVIAGRARVDVERIELREHSCKAAYVLLVRTTDAISVVAAGASDARFKAMYGLWAEAGACKVFFENLRNGRLQPMLVQWPSACAGEPPVAGSSAGDAAAFRTISGDASIQAVVEGEARRAQTRISCFSSEVVDESQWDLGYD
jgi:hypothetical protein